MPEKIKVLQLGSPIGLYGAERWILTLLKYIDSTKIESSVGSLNDEGQTEIPLCTEASKLGFPAHKIECDRKFNLSAVRNLRTHINKHKIDIIHTHGYKTDLIGRLATIGTPCKIISTPHGWTEQPRIKLRLYELMDRLAFPFFDAVAPLSEGILDSLCHIPGLKKKLTLIRNGVDIDEIEDLDSISEEILSLKRNGAFVIGYIGRLIPGKGLDILFNSLAEYAEPHWKVVILGEGEQASELEALARSLNINDKVEFFGFRADRLAFLKGFDVFVLPSRSEGIPRCVMEAMSADVPVIASDIPGCRNLIDGKSTGLLFELNNHHELAQSIKILSTDIEKRKNIQSAGKAFIRANYSAATMAKSYEKLFFNLLKRSG